MLSTCRAISNRTLSHLHSSSFPSASTVRCLSSSSISSSSVNDTLNRIQASSSNQPSSNRQDNQVHTPRSGSDPSFIKIPSTPSRDPNAPFLRTPNFKTGHYYDPSSLAPPNQDSPSFYRAQPLLGPKNAEAIKTDPIHQLNLHPAKPSLSDDSYKNGALLSSFVSDMGRILPRSQTRLTRRSQREIGKAVRRARSMGLIPTMSRGKRGGGWQI